MEEKIKQIIFDVFNVPVENITNETLMKDLPTWDSLMHIEMVAEIERTFSVKFKPEEIAEITGYQKIKDLLSSKGVK